MSFKRIALCVMYAMITMFVINTATANAEDEVVIEGTTEECVSFNSEACVAPVQPIQDETLVMAGAVTTGAAADTEQSNDVNAAHADNVTEPAQQPANDKDTAKEEKTGKEAEKKSAAKDNSKKREKAKYSKAELRLLSTLIYCEAGAEPYAGKLAVGIVVMNRKESRSFANSVKGVIYQRGQFSPVRNGSLNRALARYDAGKFNSAADKQCIKAAKAALSGEKVVSYNGKNKNFKSFKFFNGYVRGARYRIKGHMFK